MKLCTGYRRALYVNFHSHIDHIVGKSTNKLGLLYKTKTLFDERTALMLYKSLIVPDFNYGCLLYEVAPEYQLKRPQTVQIAAAHLILEQFTALLEHSNSIITPSGLCATVSK